MNILVITNFFPPYIIGGYELLCQDVANSLKERGHTITILTSNYGLKSSAIDDHVYRFLNLEADIDYYRIRDAWLYPRKSNNNVHHLRNLIAKHQPDVVFIWGMWSLSKPIAEEAEMLMGSRVVYYLANPWPIQPNMHVAYWDSPENGLIGKIVKPVIRVPARVILRKEWKPYHLRFEHAPCCSIALRDQLLAAGIPLQDAPIIYEGINLDSYVRSQRENTNQKLTLALLYVGILAPHKGVHTAIEAISLLAPNIRSNIRLTILGAGQPGYESRLHNMVSENNLGDYIAFKNPIPRTELPEFLSQYDVLLLPSIWEEPLALIMQEALANGLVVVGTMTGGTKEIILDGDNGMLFPAGDSTILARKINLLVNDPGMRLSLAKNGQATAEAKFNIHRMVDELEAYLTAVVHEAPVYQ